MSRPQVAIAERHMAEAGYYVLLVIPARDGIPAAVERQAVLHWGYEKGDELSIPYPITLGGVVVDDSHILRPDGAIERADGEVFSSLEEFLQAVRDGDV